MNNEEMKELRNLLSIDNLVSVSDIPGRFKVIAEELMNNYCIMKGNVRYEFVEIEFYLYSQTHPDIITYPRNARCGDWFFHQSGVDICFGPLKDAAFQRKSYDEIVPVKEGDRFGGILIRSMKKMVKNNGKYEFVKYITGPLNCCYELFDQFSAFKPENGKFEYPYIEKKNPAIKDEVLSCPRYINVSNVEGKCKSLLKKLFNEDFQDTDEKFKKWEEIFENYKSIDYRFYLKSVFENPTDENIKKYKARPMGIQKKS